MFVGALMASGVCMIAYKGRSKLEDYALNFAGFNAFFVALVPNNFTAVLNRAATTSLTTGDVVTREQLLTNLRFVLTAFLITSALFIYFDYKLMNWSAFKWGRDETKFASALVVVSWVTEIVFLLGIVGGVLAGRETLFGLSIFGILHFTAASLLIANLSFAAASHAFPLKLRSPQLNATAEKISPSALKGYRCIVAAMWGGLIIGGLCIVLGVSYSVIVTEYVEIGLFVAYWLIATRGDWSTPPLTVWIRRRPSRPDACIRQGSARPVRTAMRPPLRDPLGPRLPPPRPHAEPPGLHRPPRQNRQVCTATPRRTARFARPPRAEPPGSRGVSGGGGRCRTGCG